jgi:hypothetical protein
VAPDAAPPTEAPEAPVETAEATPDPEAVEPLPEEEAAAPPEAAAEVATEADEPSGEPEAPERPSGAVAQAVRPPARPSRSAETETIASSDGAEEAPEPSEADDADVLAALEAASSGVEEGGVEEGGAAASDPGPPMTGSERDAFRVAVQGCWNLSALSTEALRTTVAVVFELGRDGRVVGDVELLTSSGGEGEAVRTAFEAAKRAILRCQGDGFPLPPEKFEQWRLVEMRFNAQTQTVQ